MFKVLSKLLKRIRVFVVLNIIDTSIDCINFVNTLANSVCRALLEDVWSLKSVYSARCTRPGLLPLRSVQTTALSPLPLLMS